MGNCGRTSIHVLLLVLLSTGIVGTLVFRSGAPEVVPHRPDPTPDREVAEAPREPATRGPVPEQERPEQKDESREKLLAVVRSRHLVWQERVDAALSILNGLDADGRRLWAIRIFNAGDDIQGFLLGAELYNIVVPQFVARAKELAAVENPEAVYALFYLGLHSTEDFETVAPTRITWGLKQDDAAVREKAYACAGILQPDYSKEVEDAVASFIMAAKNPEDQLRYLAAAPGLRRDQQDLYLRLAEAGLSPEAVKYCIEAAAHNCKPLPDEISPSQREYTKTVLFRLRAHPDPSVAETAQRLWNRLLDPKEDDE